MLRLSDVAIHAYRGEFYLFGTLSEASIPDFLSGS